MGQKIDNQTLKIFEYFFTLSSLKGQEKLFLLQKASVKLDLLKVLVRLAKDVRALDHKKYLHLQLLLAEIGKMLGGWIKAVKQTV